ncbi:Zn-ribbon domain-containing OB-fold protein [Streptomyces sp. GQFP]|uniref:Zn-ribbon domain-containing OB-fold protein n=1 Tax=Streptomyces sp. GQFP TaxID=2907545 RepID=UPI001F26DE62|nr:Zn-ribbon domain-containing OB-fold protein [Streptomyces sp. GQFP]UIX29326.1 Zn-ribbon domain-containing OB-fold protein [Streptomyces sp. GQFP]
MTTMRSDLPTVEGEAAHYWTAARDGVLLLVRCDSCGHVHHYPRPFCPKCWSEDLTDQPASGRATLYTYSTVFVNDLPPFKERLPYVAAVVDLAEGPRLMTTIVGCPPDELSIGMSLVAEFTEVTDDVTAVAFRPDPRSGD